MRNSRSRTAAKAVAVKANMAALRISAALMGASALLLAFLLLSRP
jgi:hypothetical protein